MQRYSKKRQAILACLQGTKSHPTAEWIFEQLRPDYPDMSFATVYRNLSQMKEAGLIRSVGVVDGHERFDGTPEPHAHVVCTRCGCVADVEGLSVSPEIIQSAERAAGFQIAEGSYRFRGICGSCAAEITHPGEKAPI